MEHMNDDFRDVGRPTPQDQRVPADKLLGFCGKNSSNSISMTIYWRTGFLRNERDRPENPDWRNYGIDGCGAGGVLDSGAAGDARGPPDCIAIRVSPFLGHLFVKKIIPGNLTGHSFDGLILTGRECAFLQLGFECIFETSTVKE